MEDGEVAPAARFSDGEASPVSPTSPVREAARAAGGRRPAASAADAGRSGFDFSGAASADAWQRTCPICGEPLELEYSTRRHELVVPGAVTLNHRTYHEACNAARAMPSARVNSTLYSDPIQHPLKSEILMEYYTQPVGQEDYCWLSAVRNRRLCTGALHPWWW